MGTPLPENPIGAACPICWGAGKPFGSGPTPEILTMTLFDLQEGAFWIEALRAEIFAPTKLFQNGFPCEWLAVSSNIGWFIGYSIFGTDIRVIHIPTATQIFISNDSGLCGVEGPNNLLVPAGNFAFDGTFEITFSEIFT